MKFYKIMFLLPMIFGGMMFAPNSKNKILDEFTTSAQIYLKAINGNQGVSVNGNIYESIAAFTYSQDKQVKDAAHFLNDFKGHCEQNQGENVFSHLYEKLGKSVNLFASIADNYAKNVSKPKFEDLYNSLFRNMCRLYKYSSLDDDVPNSKNKILDEFTTSAQIYLKAINGNQGVSVNGNIYESIAAFTYSQDKQVKDAAYFLNDFKGHCEQNQGENVFSHLYSTLDKRVNLFASIADNYAKNFSKFEGLYNSLFRDMCRLYKHSSLDDDVPNSKDKISPSHPKTSNANENNLKEALLFNADGWQRPVYQNMIEAFVLGDAIGAMYEGYGFDKIKDGDKQDNFSGLGLPGTSQHIIYKRIYQALTEKDFLLISEDRVKKIIGDRGFYYGPTDDTATSIAVGMSILNNELELGMVTRWANWLYWGDYDMMGKTGHSTGAGENLKKFILAFDQGRSDVREKLIAYFNKKSGFEPPQSASQNAAESVKAADPKHPHNLGNGCLMKMLFSLIYDLAQGNEFKNSTTLFQAKITHDHDEALMSLQFIFELTKKLLNQSQNSPMDCGDFKILINDTLNLVKANSDFKFFTNTFQESIAKVLSEFEVLTEDSDSSKTLLYYGNLQPSEILDGFWMIAPGLRASETLQGVLLSLLLALHDFNISSHFKDAQDSSSFVERVLRRAIGLAGDTDSVAALAGMMAACMNVKTLDLNHQIPDEKLKNIWKGVNQYDRYKLWIGKNFDLGEALINFDQRKAEDLEDFFTHKVGNRFPAPGDAGKGTGYVKTDKKYLVGGRGGYKTSIRVEDGGWTGFVNVILPLDVNKVFYKGKSTIDAGEDSDIFRWWIDEVTQYVKKNSKEEDFNVGLLRIILSSTLEKIKSDANKNTFLTEDKNLWLSTTGRDGQIIRISNSGDKPWMQVYSAAEAAFRKYVRFLIIDGWLQFSRNKDRTELATEGTFVKKNKLKGFSQKYAFKVAKDETLNGVKHFNDIVRDFDKKFESYRENKGEKSRGGYLAALSLYKELRPEYNFEEPFSAREHQSSRQSSSSPHHATSSRNKYSGTSATTRPYPVSSFRGGAASGKHADPNEDKKVKAQGILEHNLLDAHYNSGVIFDLNAEQQSSAVNCPVYVIWNLLSSDEKKVNAVEELEKKLCTFLTNNDQHNLVDPNTNKLKNDVPNEFFLEFMKTQGYNIPVFNAENRQLVLSYVGDYSDDSLNEHVGESTAMAESIKANGGRFILNITTLGSEHFIAVYFYKSEDKIYVYDSQLIKKLNSKQILDIAKYIDVLKKVKTFLEAVLTQDDGWQPHYHLLTEPSSSSTNLASAGPPLGGPTVYPPASPTNWHSTTHTQDSNKIFPGSYRPSNLGGGSLNPTTVGRKNTENKFNVGASSRQRPSPTTTTTHSYQTPLPEGLRATRFLNLGSLAKQYEMHISDERKKDKIRLSFNDYDAKLEVQSNGQGKYKDVLSFNSLSSYPTLVMLKFLENYRSNNNEIILALKGKLSEKFLSSIDRVGEVNDYNLSVKLYRDKFYNFFVLDPTYKAICSIPAGDMYWARYYINRGPSLINEIISLINQAKAEVEGPNRAHADKQVKILKEYMNKHEREWLDNKKLFETTI